MGFLRRSVRAFKEVNEQFEPTTDPGVVLEARGSNGRIQLFNDMVFVERKSGDSRTIPFDTITSVEFKKAGIVPGALVVRYRADRDYQGQTEGFGVFHAVKQANEFEAMARAIKQVSGR